MSGEDRLQKQSDGSVWIERRAGQTGWAVHFRVAMVGGERAVIELRVRPAVETLIPSHGLTGTFLRRAASPAALLQDALVEEAFSELLIGDTQQALQSRGRQRDTAMLARVALIHDAMSATDGIHSISRRIHVWLEESGLPCHRQSVRRWVGQLRALGILDQGSGRLTETGRQFVNSEFPGVLG